MIKKLFSAVLALMMSAAFVSCLNSSDDEDNTVYLNGLCTIQQSGSMAFWMDGGAVIYPTAESAAALKSNEGFDKVKRALLTVTYNPDVDVTESEGLKVIRNAEVYEGQSIRTFDLLTLAQAEAKNVFSPDSIDTFADISTTNGVWIYKGYLNVQFTSVYLYRNSAYIIPTCNAVYEINEDNPSVINIHLYNNMHRQGSRNEQGGSSTFINCYDITPLQHYVKSLGSSQSVTFNITYELSSGTNTITKTVEQEHFEMPF